MEVESRSVGAACSRHVHAAVFPRSTCAGAASARRTSRDGTSCEPVGTSPRRIRSIALRCPKSSKARFPSATRTRQCQLQSRNSRSPKPRRQQPANAKRARISRRSIGSVSIRMDSRATRSLGITSGSPTGCASSASGMTHRPGGTPWASARRTVVALSHVASLRPRRPNSSYADSHVLKLRPAAPTPPESLTAYQGAHAAIQNASRPPPGRKTQVRS